MLPPELLFFFFLMIRRPPRSTLFPTRRSSDLTFWNVREHSLADIWDNSPSFMAFRGTDWMQEPCRSCPKAKEDFGGCRCQAFALTGDARATDPVCHLSPRHALVAELAEMRTDLEYEYRG